MRPYMPGATLVYSVCPLRGRNPQSASPTAPFQRSLFPLSITVRKEEKWYVSIHLMEVGEKCGLFAEKNEGCRLLLYASGVFTANVR